LANPTSHLLTLVIGMGMVYKFGVLYERDRNAKLMDHVEQLFKLQEEALARIGEMNGYHSKES